MSASDLMDPNPTTLKPTDDIGTAAACIMEHRYRNVPVIDDDGCFVGIFGVHCLLKMTLPNAAIMHQGLDNLSFIHETLEDLYNRYQEIVHKPISSCMSTDVEIVPPGHPLLETLLILYRTKTSIPVVEPDSCKLLGMISYWDVGRSILAAAKEQQDA